MPTSVVRILVSRHSAFYSPLISAVAAGFLADEGIEAAFRAGRGDYVHQQGPQPQQLEQEGIAHVVASVGEAMPPVAFSSLMAMPSFLDSAEARAFTRAYRRARTWAQGTTAEEVTSREAPFFPGVDRDTRTAAIRRYQPLGCWLGNSDAP